MPSRPFRYSNWHRYLGIAVAIVCAVGTLSIFHALRMEQRHHVGRMTHLAAEAIREDLIADMQARTLAEAGFAAMWNGETLTRRNWDLNASLLMGHHSGSVAVFWLNRSGRVIWATYKEPRSVRVGALSNQALLETLPRLRAGDPHPVLSSVFKADDGGRVLRWSVTNAQSRTADKAYVAILYDAEESLAGMLRDVEGLGYAIKVNEHGTPVYSFVATQAADGGNTAELTTVTLPGDTLEVAVWPTRETLEQLESHLPQAALLIAITLSVLVIIATRLATVARLRSRDLQVTNEQLMSEMRERERIEAALVRSRARFAAILDMSGDAIVCCNERGVITLFNESAERMFQQKAEEIIGEGIDSIIGGTLHEDSGRGSTDASRSEALAVLHRSAHITARRKDDSRFPADVTVSILDVEQEKIVTVILRDVTERHQMERELRSARSQLESRVAERTEQLAESVFQLQAEVNLRNQAELSLRELSARILQLQDSERRRIARELHDSTAQVLVAASMNMATIQEHVTASGDLVVGIVKDTSQLIEQAQSEIRTISYLLHPPLLEELGLASAIDWYASGFSKRSGVQVSFDVAPDLGRLPQEYELTLFRIVQEGLTNVHRHSRSRTAQIYLARGEEGIHLEIADQGAGVEDSKLKALDSGGTLGVGVAGMRERVRQLGGTVTMASNGKGTVISTHIPLIGEFANVDVADRVVSHAAVTQTALA